MVKDQSQIKIVTRELSTNEFDLTSVNFNDSP